MVREKGKTLEEAGGLVVESHLWLTPQVPELKELADFRMKYSQAVYGQLARQAAPQLTQALAMYPQMKDAMAKMAEESQKLSGTPLFTETVFQMAAPPGQASGDRSAGAVKAAAHHRGRAGRRPDAQSAGGGGNANKGRRRAGPSPRPRRRRRPRHRGQDPCNRRRRD